jgi:stage V sporulation protein D (sporulation-specific penicillin-binding protein)
MAPWIARIRQRIETRRRPAPAADWRQTMRRRMGVATVCLVCWGIGIEARLFYMQVIGHEDYKAIAAKQQTRQWPLKPRRGDVHDRNFRLLATSADVDIVFADPERLEDVAKTVAALCGVIKCSDSERREITTRFSRKNSNYARVRRVLTPEEAQRIADLNLKGVYPQKESRRHYPKDELAASVLGWVGDGENGLGGIEYAYNKVVGGTEGQLFYSTDGDGNIFNRVEVPAVPGADLQLTVDEHIQYTAERELEAAVRKHQAKGGSVVVVVPRTGEILAMATYPTFDPNNYTVADAERSRNWGAQYSYEPGSTFKIVTAAAAIEEHVLPLDTMINTEPGMIRVGSGKPITEYEHHNYHTLSFTDVLVHSSNIGAVKIGLRVGAERLARYVSRFGFGGKVSADFPSEAKGFFRPPQSDRELASNSMGYQVSVTPLQMVAAISSIANGGEYVQPRIVKAFYHNGKPTPVVPQVVRRSVAPDTAATLTTIMEQVVERGTATLAKIPGYTIAGKTGTANKLANGNYSQRGENHVSFAGFVPSRNPAIAMVVMIDEPHAGGRAGGAVAAPVFQRIAEETLGYLGIPPSINPPAPVLVVQDRRGAPSLVPTGTTIQPPPISERIETQAGTIPDLRGLTARDASRAITKLGLYPELSGTGFVRTQDPPAGTPIEVGMVCRIALDRGPERRTTAPGQP